MIKNWYYVKYTTAIFGLELKWYQRLWWILTCHKAAKYYSGFIDACKKHDSGFIDVCKKYDREKKKLRK